MGRLMEFDFFLAPESAVALDPAWAQTGMPATAAQPRPTADTARRDADAWARRAMAASGFGEGDRA
ncbi:MAG: hypothetical protein ACOZDY_04925 [Pseudomonadota bacterium]